jgi:hypothetical protein
MKAKSQPLQQRFRILIQKISEIHTPFTAPTAHAAWVAAGRKACGRWFCDDFQVAKFSVSSALSGLFPRASAPFQVI